MPKNTILTRDYCRELDADDPLSKFSEKFELPDAAIYLDGNSLGAMPKATAQRVRHVVEEEWAIDLIKSWNIHDWINLPQRCGDKIARLIGAEAGEVVVADSTSINLFKMLAGALRLNPDRRVIVSEKGNFPTDLYIMQGLIELLGGRHELRLVEADEVLDAIDDDLAVLSLTHVNYKTGRIHDMAGITKAVHEAGGHAIWDLAHSAGALPVDLNGCNVDFAVGCGYKYLNGGPGAPAFLFVAKRHQEAIDPPLSGWMGHADPFAFDPVYRPAEGIARNLCGTPAVISMSALETSLDVMLEADMQQIRQKSVALGDLFVDLVEQECGEWGFAVASPPAEQRGSQVGLTHPDGYPIMQALISRGVIGDFRAPDLLRFGFAPLYIRYVDIWDSVATLKDIMKTRGWDKPQFKARAAVT